MLFKKNKKKQVLLMDGNLVLSKNKQLVTTSVPSAMPHLIQGGDHAFVRKGSRIRATLTALFFIWGN